MRVRLLPVTIFVAVLLLGVRVGSVWETVTQGRPLPEVSPLQAQTAEAVPDSAPVADVPATQLAQATMAAEGDASADEPSSVEMEVIRHINERRRQLDERERALDQREAMLVVAERRLEEKVTELTVLRDEIQALLDQRSEMDQEQLLSLVKIYETMKPKDAARIFEALDQPVLLDVVERMKENKVAPIFAAMDPMKAREVTAALAQGRDLPALMR